MKTRKTYLFLFAVLFLTVFPAKSVRADEIVSGGAVTEQIVSGSAVSGGAISGPAVITKPQTVVKDPFQLKLKKTKQLRVKFDGKVVWSSSKPKVAFVSKKGIVKAKAVGDTVITAQMGNQKLKWKVRVVERYAHQNEWVERKGYHYYYDKFGVKATGRKTIDGKKYYFDSQGRQRVGWISINEDYYFYQIGKQKNGYLKTDTTVNGIALKKNGKAKLTSDTRDKVKYLTYANELCSEYLNPSMSRKEALEKMYQLMAKGEIISYYNYGPFQDSKNWDQNYVAYFFDRGIGDCYTAGCVFAYIATALGCEEVYAESSGGHGWCRIGEKYYDPNWGFWGTDNMMDGFAVKPEDSGKNGRLNWKLNCRYSKKIS